VLRAAHAIMEETTEIPILIGRPDVMRDALRTRGPAHPPDRDFQIVNPESDSRYREYWETYHQLMERRGVTPDIAKAVLRTNSTAIGAIMVHRGEADSLICGTFGQYLWHLNYVTRGAGARGAAPGGGAQPDHPVRRAAVHRRYAGQRRTHARSRLPKP
jgi:malate dehydrogenase (oxaloacetate-decarboxylating)(NADP+)